MLREGDHFRPITAGKLLDIQNDLLQSRMLGYDNFRGPCLPHASGSLRSRLCGLPPDTIDSEDLRHSGFA